MSTLRRVLLVVACLLLAIPLAPPASAAPVLVWSDEFDGPSGARPNSAKWAYDIGNGSGGWGNNELEAYTDKTSNVSLNGTGQLVITARKENSGMPCWNGGNCQYTSGKLTTYNRVGWTYGRIETRMKLPYGQGIWPAFWMLGANIGQVGWPNCGEIDIMENIGREPNTVHGTIHGPATRVVAASARRGSRRTARRGPPPTTPIRSTGRPTGSSGSSTACSTRPGRPPTWAAGPGCSTTSST